MNVRLARQLAERDPEASGKILDQLGEAVQEAVQELRALAHGIYPPLLIDRGIAEALRSAAGRAALPTEVDAEGLDRYSPEREAAVYFCCMEALQNAGKHAGDGAAAFVRVWEDGANLFFEVRDTGAGFDANGTLASGRRLREHERPGRSHRRHRQRDVRARRRDHGGGVASPSAPDPAAATEGPLDDGGQRSAGSGAVLPQADEDVGAELLLVDVSDRAARAGVGGQVLGVVGRQQDDPGLGMGAR